MFLRLESSISGNIKNLFRVFFHFLSAERALSKNKKNMRLESSISKNIRNLLMLELGSSIS